MINKSLHILSALIQNKLKAWDRGASKKLDGKNAGTLGASLGQRLIDGILACTKNFRETQLLGSITFVSAEEEIPMKNGLRVDFLCRSFLAFFVLFLSVPMSLTALSASAQVISNSDDVWEIPNLNSEPSVIGGTEVGVNVQEFRGLVMVNRGCSGVLLTNDIVLTAGHCILNNRDPGSVIVTANWGSSANRTRGSKAIYQFAGYAEERGADLALVFLASAFEVNGSTTGFSNQLNLDEPNSLLNQPIIVYGLGLNALPSQGFGTWRTADVVVSNVQNPLYTFNANAAGQIIWKGDSGGPDFIGSKITGIHSGASYSCSNNSTPALCLATVTQVTAGSSVSIPAMKNAIQAVRSTVWNPSDSTVWLDVFSDEINATEWGWGDPNDVNLVHWAQAGRSAYNMCYNRGLVGGHFTGHVVLEVDHRGLLCSSRGTIWHDASAQELQNVGAGFTDVNLVPWAQANRAAIAICESFNQGFVGGHFNGHQAPAGYGLLCYKDNAIKFDVTKSEFASLGYPIEDVNLIHWAYAGRAASDYCYTHGFVSGFMNGHQSGEFFGVVCHGNSTSTSTSVSNLSLNYSVGAPGSYFTLDGVNFVPNSPQFIKVNGDELGSVMTDRNGQFRVVISTNVAELGRYLISTENPSSPVEVTLAMAAEFHDREDSSAMELPIAPVNERQVFMPLILH
jgi:hypothetical protein